MAWKQPPKPGAPMPFSEISHLNPQILNFVVNLRKNENDSDLDPHQAWLEKLPPDQRKLIEDEEKAGRKKVGSNKKCTRSSCKVFELQISQQLLEKANIMKNISSAEIYAHDIEEQAQENQIILEELERENNELSNTYQELHQIEKVEQKKRMLSLIQKRRQIEHEIKVAEKMATRLRREIENDKSSHISSSVAESTEIGLGFVKDDDKDKNSNIKHTGIYCISIGGKRQWSCCLNEEEDAPGCGDDCSIGIKSTLVLRNPSGYRPHKVMVHGIEYQKKLARDQYYEREREIANSRPSTTGGMNMRRSMLNSNTLNGNNNAPVLKSNLKSSLQKHDKHEKNDNKITIKDDDGNVFVTGFAESMSMSALGLSSPIRKYDPSASRVHSNFINKTKISKIATGGSMLSYGNMLTGSKPVGVLRTTRDPVTFSSDIHRVGGRPLTAQCGKLKYFYYKFSILLLLSS